MRIVQRWRQRVLPSSVLYLLVLWVISSRLSSSNASTRSGCSRDFLIYWKNWWEDKEETVDSTTTTTAAAGATSTSANSATSSSSSTTTTITISRFLSMRGGAQELKQPHHHHVADKKQTTNNQDEVNNNNEHDNDDDDLPLFDDQKMSLVANDTCPLESLHTTTTTTTAGATKNRHIPSEKQQQGFLEQQESMSPLTAQQQQQQEENNVVNDDDINEDSKTSTLERRRLLFLDRIALISASWMRREHDAKVTMLQEDADADADIEQQRRTLDDLNAVTAQSDLSLPGRHFHIVTTAALPWFTGTAVNPLLRAAYLHRRTLAINNNNNNDIKQNNTTALSSVSTIDATDTDTTTIATTAAKQPPHRFVTLVVPWLELPEDQQDLYGHVFENPAAQEAFIRNWLREQAEMPDVACSETGLHIVFYPARYHSGLRSIFAMGDMLRVIEEENTPLDVCVLEEPEHVNWFRAPGDGWTQKYNYVLGIVHTNYKEYASSHYSGLWTAPAIQMVSSAMVRAYCHKVIKLSAVLQTYAPEKEIVSNVHGVRAEFLKEGMRRSQQQQQHDKLNTVQVAAASASNVNNYYHNNSTNSAGIYFIGKLLWAKGLDLLLDMEDYYKQCTGSYFPIDVYGSGPEATVIMKAFHGRRGKLSNNNNNNNRTMTAEDIEQRGSNGKTKKNWRRNPASQFLGTTLSIFGGSASPFKWKRPTQPLEDDLDSSSSRQTDRLANLQGKARERLARIKQTLDSVDIPQTFAELRRQPIPAMFPGRVDHAELKHHKIFVNPSISEVLCTTTAEALAMGKFAIIPVHPSNSFFMKFPNCLAYRNKFEFVASLRWAMTHEPEPLTPELARHFTWEAATDRFIEASAITVGEALQREKLGLSRLDERIAWFHNEIGKGATGDMLRRIFGAGPVSEQVRYVKEQKRMGDDIDTSAPSSEDEDEDDGLSRKFRQSSFAEAIRATVGDMSSFIQ